MTRMHRYRVPELYNDEEESLSPLPFVFEICSTCRGHGRNSLHMGAYTRDEMDQQGPDFQEDYMNGFYDRQCQPCEGTGKVKVADRSRMTEAQIAAYDRQNQEDDDYDAICEAERRMGC